MHCLLDTNVLIGAATETGVLAGTVSEKTLAIINNPSHSMFVSIVSLWEIAIKTSLRKLTIDDGIFEVESHGYELLPIEVSHLKQLLFLPHHHRDPFDRLLVAQAMAEKLTLITSDKDLQRYDAKIILA